MKVIVVGLGIQGRKRLAVAGGDVVATVDPVATDATFRHIEDVPLDRYEAALVCTPDSAKVALLEYLLVKGKHILVEKPLLSASPGDLTRLAELAAAHSATCYTAYNHRFEPHLASLRSLVEDGQLGRIYQARFFYGNGTARDVRNSPWRDQGLGVIPDLASHLLDLCLFCFGRPAGLPEVWSCERFENAAPDYFLLGFPGATPRLTLQGTLLSWRNHFTADLVGEHGSVHVIGLCKWGPTSLVVRRRILPSGKPPEEVHTLEQGDPTWALEYDHFKSLCRGPYSTNIDNDIWIDGVLANVAQQIGVTASL